jgi:hemin uptake protein HemP
VLSSDDPTEADPVTEPQKPPQPAPPPEPPVVVDARQIFAGRREVLIRHDGVQYRLRITRRNKLILQK